MEWPHLKSDAYTRLIHPTSDIDSGTKCPAISSGLINFYCNKGREFQHEKKRCAFGSIVYESLSDHGMHLQLCIYNSRKYMS